MSQPNPTLTAQVREIDKRHATLEARWKADRAQSMLSGMFIEESTQAHADRATLLRVVAALQVGLAQAIDLVGSLAECDYWHGQWPAIREQVGRLRDLLPTPEARRE